MGKKTNIVPNHPFVRKYTAFARRDLAATYSRGLHKWLLVAPIMGALTGLAITLIAEIILKWMWPPILQYYLHHSAAIVPGLMAGFLVAGLVMQYLTPNPDEHSTEEIIRSYHEHQGAIEMRPFLPKLLAAIATVGSGGSAALEGPSIYGGGAIGAWMWKKLRKAGLQPRDRRILLISGAAAGMSAVFRAPLTGVIFALEMPYKDDLAHEALLPALISSVVSYATMAAFMGAKPLFDFAGGTVYSREDLLWSALLGALCGLVAMVFDITFRRTRTFFIQVRSPHWMKMMAGGILTGACGLAFISLYKGSLIPIGPNYEAVSQILQQAHSSAELLTFGFLKLAATLFSLGAGGVSAMFVPLFLTGGAFGTAFAQSAVHSQATGLYAAVGMAAFIAAGYKTPLAAVAFVAEATGGHAFIVPTLIGAAVAYAVSGEASVSADQRLHESVTLAELGGMSVGNLMQKRVICASPLLTVRDFMNSVGAHHPYTAYPVLDHNRTCGIVYMHSLTRLPPEQWDQTNIGAVADQNVIEIAPEDTADEALRLLISPRRHHMLLVKNPGQPLDGILTKTDIFSSMNFRHGVNEETRNPS